MKNTPNFKDSVALITGAASGIGRATSLELARRGTHLALLDRDAVNLETVATEARLLGVKVTTYVVDLRNEQAVLDVPNAVIAAHGKINILINAAGVALIGRFEKLTLEEFRWLIDINFWSVIVLTKACLAYMQKEDYGHIVNFSSVWGLAAPAGRTGYATSKFAIRGFSDALRHEFDGSNMGMSVVYPAGIQTPITLTARVAAAVDPQAAKRAQEALNAKYDLSPETAAQIIVSGIEKRKARVLIGRPSFLIDWLTRLFPVGYWNIIKKSLAATNV
jgi:short-subunit dehydrogenase